MTVAIGAGLVAVISYTCMALVAYILWKKRLTFLKETFLTEEKEEKVKAESFDQKVAGRHRVTHKIPISQRAFSNSERS
jgi:hypothetical protein